MIHFYSQKFPFLLCSKRRALPVNAVSHTALLLLFCRWLVAAQMPRTRPSWQSPMSQTLLNTGVRTLASSCQQSLFAGSNRYILPVAKSLRIVNKNNEQQQRINGLFIMRDGVWCSVLLNTKIVLQAKLTGETLFYQFEGNGFWPLNIRKCGWKIPGQRWATHTVLPQLTAKVVVLCHRCECDQLELLAKGKQKRLGEFELQFIYLLPHTFFFMCSPRPRGYAEAIRYPCSSVAVINSCG